MDKWRAENKRKDDEEMQRLLAGWDPDKDAEEAKNQRKVGSEIQEAAYWPDDPPDPIEIEFKNP